MALGLLKDSSMSKITFGDEQIKSFERRRPTRILIVESDAPVREGLARALKLECYEVSTAVNGSEALGRHDDFSQIDAVLLDLDLADEHRWQAVRQLSSANPLLSVIGMTARPTRHALADAADLEAVIEKPFEVPALLRILNGAQSLSVLN